MLTLFFIFTRLLHKSTNVNSLEILSMDVHKFIQQRLITQKRELYNQPCLSKIGDYLANNYQQNSFKVADFSSELHISERTLRRKCKQLFNASPNELLNIYRVAQAKSMFELTPKTIGEIALEVGFPSHSHFSTTFKKYEGISPEQYKQMKNR